MAKHFLENASQDEVVKAEQEAAIIHQQLNAGIQGVAEVPPTTPVAAVPATPGEMPLEIPAPTAALAMDTTAQLTAMTTRATGAEAKVTDLQSKLTALEANRDLYKSWYDKQVGLGTALPGADATNRGAAQGEQTTLSAASSAALATFQKRKQASL